MKIAPELIKTKAKAGKTEDGSPVMYIETHGGLHAFFSKKEEKWVALGAAQHRAIASFFAEKKAESELLGKIKWTEDFLGKSEQESRTEADRLRNEFFYPVELKKTPGDYLVYDLTTKEIDLMDHENVSYGIENQLFSENTLIRREHEAKPTWINKHPDFLNKSNDSEPVPEPVEDDFQPSAALMDKIISAGIVELVRKAQDDKDEDLLLALKQKTKEYLKDRKVLRG